MTKGKAMPLAEMFRAGAITRFRGEYAFLSNLYIEPDGTHVEGEFQARKARTERERRERTREFMRLMPGEAKRAGKTLLLRGDWEEVKVEEMRELQLDKFLEHKVLREKLLATGERELVEGPPGGSRFWGCVETWKDGVWVLAGENWCGKNLMWVRKEIRRLCRK